MIGDGSDKRRIYETFIRSVIDPDKPNVARIYDYCLGGNNWFDVDRQAAEEVIASVPHVREMALHNRSFLQRAVRFIAQDCGVQQFLDLGTGLPTQGNVHEVAHEVNPEARVVYVDNDPVVLAYARTLRVLGENVTVLTADIREPNSILRSSDVRELIDFSEPIALLFFAILHFIKDDEHVYDIVGAYREAVPPGSYIAITHVLDVPQNRPGISVYRQANAPAVPRGRPEISRLFEGFQLLVSRN